MENLSRKDKTLGAMLGFAIGDAWGATTEFMTSQEIRKQYGAYGVKEIMGGGWLKLPKGQVTDDTQMMMCVARAIEGSIGQPINSTMSLVAANFIDWFNSDPIDIGKACACVIQYAKAYRLEYWVEWKALSETLQNNRASHYGNGALMRALPCFTLLSDIGKRTKYAVEQGKMTHNNPVSSRIISAYIKILDGDTDLFELYSAKHVPPTGHVENTLRNACYHVSKSKGTADPFYSAVHAAVNDGGDADTIAAITGSIAGYKCGMTGLPSQLLMNLDKKVAEEIIKIVDLFYE